MTFIWVHITLCSLYLLLFVIPVIQLIRIWIANPDSGWSTQTLFLLLTSLVSLARSVLFALLFIDLVSKGPSLDLITSSFFHESPTHPLFAVLDDSPTILLFGTYLLLVLFWVEVLFHARRMAPAFSRKVRPAFVSVCFVVCLIQIVVWILMWVFPSERGVMDAGNNWFHASIFLGASIGFLAGGGRLYSMLKNAPRQTMSADRQRRQREVGIVTVVCTLAFLTRAVLNVIATYTPLVNAIYVFLFFLFAEIMPCILVILILRKIPQQKPPPADRQRLISPEGA